MKKLFLLSLILLALGACSSMNHSHPTAMATLASTSGSTAKGTVTFEDMGNGEVMVMGDLTGVPPGVHGFHVHDKGDCSDNGMAAGGHFNPTAMAHGAPDASAHHAGD